MSDLSKKTKKELVELVEQLQLSNQQLLNEQIKLVEVANEAEGYKRAWRSASEDREKLSASLTKTKQERESYRKDYEAIRRKAYECQSRLSLHLAALYPDLMPRASRVHLPAHSQREALANCGADASIMYITSMSLLDACHPRIDDE